MTQNPPNTGALAGASGSGIHHKKRLASDVPGNKPHSSDRAVRHLRLVPPLPRLSPAVLRFGFTFSTAAALTAAPGHSGSPVMNSTN
jgi:hypothetical protein